MSKISDSILCPDWVFVNTSNVHVAKDRGWFKTYTPFTSTLASTPYISPPSYSQVLGIGTVEIPTECSPNLSGESSHGSLQLKEVLHVPDSICNILGAPIMSDGYIINTHFTAQSRGTITDSSGRNVAYFDPDGRFFTLKVRGPPTGPLLGPSALKQGIAYTLGCQWDTVEQQKWREFKDNNGFAERISEPAGDETSRNNEASLEGH